MDTIQSRTIDLLRFPLAVLVVFIHTSPTMTLTAVLDMEDPFLSGAWCYNIIEITLSKIISQIAVPLFFLFSGFLFFQKLNTWDWNIYKRKMQNRFFSLLIPYVLWNLFAVLCLTIPPSLKVLTETNSLENMWYTFISSDYTSLKSLWDCSWWEDPVNMWGEHSISTAPLIIPLWFVRDLMIISVCSPILFLFIKSTKYWGICILTTCYILRLWPNISGLFINAIYFFTLGAFMAINKKSLIFLSHRIKWLSSFSSLICWITLILYYGHDNIGVIPILVIYNVFILSGIWFAIYISSKIVSKYSIKPSKFILQSCFFVYAFHTFPFSTTDTQYTIIGWVFIQINNIFLGTSHTDLLCYLSPPFITISFCLIFFFFLCKTDRKFVNLLIGK